MAAVARASEAAAVVPDAAKGSPERCVTLLCDGQEVAFGWREGLAAKDFGDQLRAAVRHLTGRTSLDGMELLAEITPPQRVTPRDVFEGRLPAEAAGRLRLVVPAASAASAAKPAAGAGYGGAAAAGRTVQKAPAPSQASPNTAGGGSKLLLPPQRQAPPGGGKFQKAGGSQLQFVQMLNDNKNPKAAVPEGTLLTAEEVARHSKAGDCWTIFQGRVYDITAYIDFHPGGKRQIMQGAGKDMTELFQKAHHWVSMDGLVGKLCLGPLVPSAASKALPKPVVETTADRAVPAPVTATS